MPQPLISVIIPCYNSAQYITHAIDALLCQTYKNLEIIIIDDNSTDNLKEVINPFLRKYNNIIYKNLPFDDPLRINSLGVNVNAGWMARNCGVELAKGDLITFQDADDGSCANRIEFQYNIMQEYKVNHVNIDWQQYKDEYNCKLLNYKITKNDIVSTKDILQLAQNTKKGLFKIPIAKDYVPSLYGRLNRKLKYLADWKHRDWSPYPCAASMPLIKKEVFKKCKFRSLYSRTRPSLKGRGADRDFNFWVAETFKNSVAIKIPLILWRVKTNNSNYLDEKYRPK